MDKDPPTTRIKACPIPPHQDLVVSSRDEVVNEIVIEESLLKQFQLLH